MAQKKGRGKITGLSGYYAVLITSSSGKGTGHDRDRVDTKEPGLPRIIRLNRGVMDLGAKANGQLAKQDRGLVHPNADRDGTYPPDIFLSFTPQ